MMNQNQITRLIENHEFRHLIERILANGRCRSTKARQLLIRSDIAAPAALGLALQRLCEITYRPAASATRIAENLVALQQDDGFFADQAQTPNDSLIASTAVAVRGLITYASQSNSAGLVVDDLIRSSIVDGLRAIAMKYENVTPECSDVIGWAIVLWQLGDIAELRAQVPVDHLLEILDDAASDVFEDELNRYAHAMAA